MNRAFYILVVLMLPAFSPHARADVLYTLALTATDGSNLNGTGSFVISQPPPPPPANFQEDLTRIYNTAYEEYPNVDPYGDVLESIDFSIDGLHFFLDPTYEPFTSVTFLELYPGAPGNGFETLLSDIFFETDTLSGDLNHPFALIFDVSANPNGYFQYDLERYLGNDQTLYTQGVVTVTNVETVPTPTPEPSTLALFGTGLLGALGALRRRSV